MFLFVLPAFSQLSGFLEQNPADGIYTVSVIPSVTWTPPLSTTNGAVMTLRAAKGKFQVSDFQSITGDWSAPLLFSGPAEAPDYDYFLFNEIENIVNITYADGVKLPMFSFKNAFSCTPIEIIDNQTDPLNVEPNSIGVGVGNSFSVLAVLATTGNAYTGNDPQDAVDCPPISLNIAANTNPVRCFGDVTDIMVSVENGIAPYNIQWVNTNTSETGTFSIQNAGDVFTMAGMPAGNYEFTVLDNLNSSHTSSYQLVQPTAPLSVELIAFDASCSGSMDGGVVVDKVSGGTVGNGYQYNWAGYPSETGSELTFVPAGSYNVTVTDDNGCSVTGSATVTAVAEIVIGNNSTVKHVSCNGAADGLIDIFPWSPTSGTNFDFDWSSNVPTPNESAAYNLGPGTYSVTVTDVDGGCVTTKSFTITEPPSIEVDYRLVDPKCFGEKGLLEILAVSNAVMPWKAEITGGENEMAETGDKFLLEPGSAMRLIIEDAKGCLIEEDFIVAARQEMQLEIGEGRDIKYGEQININASHFPFINVSFNWIPSEGLSCADCPNPVAMPTNNVTYKLVMTDSEGCTVDDDINFSVRKSRDIFIPNTFSPNHDGINDSFFPYGGFEIIAIHTMEVYDRWGGKMFESKQSFKPNDPGAGWHGLAREKPADPGLYLYTMNVEFIDGEIILFSGEVNLMK